LCGLAISTEKNGPCFYAHPQEYLSFQFFSKTDSDTYNNGMKNPPPLGSLSPARFLRDYWHKKPLLIRQAFPNFKPLLSGNELFQLAKQEDVEARLVTHFNRHWKVSNGPFSNLPPMQKKNWTLLLQGVNLHDDAADRLLRQFRFIPDARLDDLMISYATDQSGVGPHFDSYDVFLLQAQGRRRWRIGSQTDLSLVAGAPLKILKNFTPEQEFIVEPGDLLYLPPHYAHDGVALGGECMTYSIGFRAPSYQELGEAFLQFMADSIDLPGRYADPDLAVTRKPAKIRHAMMSQVTAELNKIRFTPDDIAIFLGQYLSEPKATVFFDLPESRKTTLARFVQIAAKRGIRLARKTQMLHYERHLFINGESFDMPYPDKTVLCQLANERQLEGAAIMAASEDVREALHTWYQDGWLTFQ
jgi:50S ribosomal protein L16 3-hydroxylase